MVAGYPPDLPVGGHRDGSHGVPPPSAPATGPGAADVAAEGDTTAVVAACLTDSACASAAAFNAAATSSTWVIVPTAAITWSLVSRRPAVAPARPRACPAAPPSPCWTAAPSCRTGCSRC